MIRKNVDEYIAARSGNLVDLGKTKAVAEGPYFALNGELH